VVKTLGALLREIDRHHWEDSLFVEADARLSASTRSQVVKTDPYTLEPLEPVEPALRRLLSVQDVQGIVSNARQQVASATVAQLIEALQYYVFNDAFVDFAATATRRSDPASGQRD